MARRASETETLIRFSHLAAEANDPGAILAELAEAAGAHGQADAAAVVEVSQDGSRLRLVAQRGLPEELSRWELELDFVDESVGERLRAACGGRFVKSQVLPLMSHGALFGALVLLFESPRAKKHDTARALADLAAAALGRSFQYRRLELAYADLRDSREALAKSARLSALGQMAAGVSHDLRNILNPLSVHLQLLARLVPKDNEDAHESIAAMRDVVQRGVDTIDRLRDFSRQNPVDDVATADLSRLAREAVDLARARLVSLRAYDIALRAELGDVPPVRVQASELVSALVNLIVNAIDALKSAGRGGNITVRIDTRDGLACVSVEDDGPGMPPEVERRVFEPFFSTKGSEGTGLGLANVYAFAKRHGGEVSLKTALGEGSTFTISLPTVSN